VFTLTTLLPPVAVALPPVPVAVTVPPVPTRVLPIPTAVPHRRPRRRQVRRCPRGAVAAANTNSGAANTDRSAAAPGHADARSADAHSGAANTNRSAVTTSHADAGSADSDARAVATATANANANSGAAATDRHRMGLMKLAPGEMGGGRGLPLRREVLDRMRRRHVGSWGPRGNAPTEPAARSQRVS
jgi:hypothetical protein